MIIKLKNQLVQYSRKTKIAIALLSDFLSLLLATYIALVVSSVDITSLSILDLLRMSWLCIFSILIFYSFNLYKTIVRYIDFTVIYLILKAFFLVFILNLALRLLGQHLLFNLELDWLTFKDVISSFGWFVGITFSIIFIVGSRLFANYLLSEKNAEKRVVIYGAGSAGIQLAGALRVSKEMQPVAFIDNNKYLQGTYIGGIKVLHPKRLDKLILKGNIDEVLIAMPSSSKSNLQNLLREIEKFSVKVRVLPGVAELALGKISVSELKEVETSDLLGRQEVEPNKKLIDRNINNKVVLITGAGGSIGSEITRQVVKNKPRKVIILDSNEYSLYSIKSEIEQRYPFVDLYSVLADVTNKERITSVCSSFAINTVYHAAAYKHVSIVEENPFEAVRNNIIGTKICAESAIEAKAETFVLVSTDKAVRPTNIMGATKRFSELILQSMSQSAKTKMSMVRFGNVIGSSGSAIPLFQKQIKDGGPVTVTHPEVTRYFMTIPEAAELVIQAGSMGNKGDVFVLDMGEPVKIFDLAKRLIRLSGMEPIDHENPNGDIEIIFTGLKPGEKLYEELLIGDNVSNTEHKRILKAKESRLSDKKINGYLESLAKAEKIGDTLSLKEILRDAVTGFIPSESIQDVVYLQKNL